MVSDDEIKKIADLSRLNLQDTEVEKFKSNINEILEYVEVLKKIDVSDVKPAMTTLDSYNVFRDDVVEESLAREQVLDNAVGKCYGCFYVTKSII